MSDDRELLEPGPGPTGSITGVPPEFIEGPREALTPMGQVDSLGSFARGLGPRRLRVALLVAAAGCLVGAALTL